MSGEEHLIELYRSLDNRGREHLLAIAEAEHRYAVQGLQKARRATLEVQTHNSIIARQNDEIKGGDDDNEGC